MFIIGKVVGRDQRNILAKYLSISCLVSHLWYHFWLCYISLILKLFAVLSNLKVDNYKVLIMVKVAWRDQRNILAKHFQQNIFRHKWRYGSKMRHGIEEYCQTFPLIISNNFNHDIHFVKMKLSCSNRGWSFRTSERKQNDVTNDVIGKKRDMISKNVLQKFSSNLVKQSQPWIFL